MGYTILTTEIAGEPGLLELRQRTRQIAGLLCFPPREQGEISAAAGVAGAVLPSTARVDADFEVEESTPAQVFLVRLSFEGEWPSGARRPSAGILDGVEVSGSRGVATVVLRKTSPRRSAARCR